MTLTLRTWIFQSHKKRERYTHACPLMHIHSCGVIASLVICEWVNGGAPGEVPATLLSTIQVTGFINCTQGVDIIVHSEKNPATFAQYE